MAAERVTKKVTWGRIDVPRLMATDPSQFPDENPLIREDGVPTPAMYEEGVFSDEFGPYPLEPAAPDDGASDDGASDEPDAAPVPAPSGDGAPVFLVVLLVLAAIVVIGVVVLIIVLATRRR